MAHIVADRIQESTTTTGTGTIALGGALTNFKTFASRMSVGDTCWYTIVDGTNSDWETGLGTYSAANTLTRTLVQQSTNADAAVSFAAGTKSVFISQGVGAPMVLDWLDAPNAPITDMVMLFGRKIAGRMLLSQIGPSGLDAALQPFLARNKVGYWNPAGNATTVPGVFGITAPTVMTGSSVTARTVKTTNLATRMRRIGYLSATTAASFAGVRIAYSQFSCGSGSNDGSGFMLVERWVESDPAVVAGRRAFAGVQNIISTATNVEPNTLTNAIGIGQLSTDATQWYWIQGGSTAQTATAIGTDIGAPGGNSTTAWELAMFCPNSTANTFYLQLTNISTGVTATTTMSGTSTQVPQSTTLLSFRHWATNNATAAAVGIDLASLYIETDT